MPQRMEGHLTQFGASQCGLKMAFQDRVVTGRFPVRVWKNEIMSADGTTELPLLQFQDQASTM